MSNQSVLLLEKVPKADEVENGDGIQDKGKGGQGENSLKFCIQLIINTFADLTNSINP